MSARIWLAAYLATVTALTFVHRPVWLAAALAIALAASGKPRMALLRRTLKAIIAFNLSVSAGYALMAWWQGRFSCDYLLLVNLRVTLLVFLGFWFVSRVNLLQALGFSRTLAFVATLAVGQVVTFARIVRDSRQAFSSRNPGAAGMIDRARHASSQAGQLLEKSVASSAETVMAMRSRGCFDD